MKQKCWCPDPTLCVSCSLQTSSSSLPTCMRIAKLVRWLQVQMVSLSPDFTKEHPFLDHEPLNADLNTGCKDYYNRLLFGLPAYQIHKIQRVQNAAARLIYNGSKYCRITPLLYNLHWLPVTFRIDFNILLLIFKVIKGFVPGYITEVINIKNEGRYRLRSSWNGILLKYVNFKTCKPLGDRSFMVAAPNLWNNLPI